MNQTLQQRLRSIQDVQLHQTLNHMQRGLEKESLRISPDGHLSQTQHPRSLGSALTHSHITTDYSEALLEFITPVHDSIDGPLQCLDQLHRFTYHNIGQEQLWVNSMPCLLGAETDIPIAWYGTSNVGRMKHVYRHGLWHRYGRPMQTIAGIHYNVSLPQSFWQRWHQLNESQASLQDFISEQYFALIRNFLRNVGLAVYLYGASPAVCSSFLSGRHHQLETLGDSTCYMPYGTSLRMSDLGYHNDAQSGLNISYNSLQEYVRSLQHAIRTPYAPYEKIGVQVNGEYRQLNTNILQIENEFYSSIRPKRVARSGERPTCALSDRGVEYIELRCIDLNPFNPLGIDIDQIRFLDVFVLYCLLSDSPPLQASEQECNINNLQTIVSQGRDPGLKLTCGFSGKEKPFREWAEHHLQGMLDVAALFDDARGHDHHRRVVNDQIKKLYNPEQTPSAQVMRSIIDENRSFHEFAMDCAARTADHFRQRPLAATEAEVFVQKATDSLRSQSELETDDNMSFEAYLDRFFSQDACAEQAAFK